MNDNESSSSENDSRQLSTGSQTGNGIPSQVLELIYKHTVHKSPVPMLICDIDGNVISYNDSFLLLSGIPHTEHKNLHTLYDIASRWNEYDASGNSTTPQESVLTKNRLQNPHYFKEIRIVRPDGSESWTIPHFTPIMPNAEKQNAGLFTFIDRTQQHQTDDALSHNQNLFHSLVQSIPHSIFTKDRHGYFTFANSAYCRMVNHTLDEIIGKTDYDLHPAEYAEKYTADDKRIMETEDVTTILETHRPKGKDPVHVQVIKSPLYDSMHNVSGVLGIFWDITDRLNAEEALRKSEAQLRNLADNIPGVIFQFYYHSESDYGFSFISEQAEALFGISSDDPDFLRTFKSHLPKEVDSAFSDIVKTAMKSGRKYDYTFPYTHPSGEKLWIQTIASPAGIGEGTVYNGVFLDITHNRKIEERNRQLEEQFYAAQRMKAVGTLAGGIAHNINNVLMGIQGRISLIQLEAGNIQSCLEHINLISQYVSSAADMTRDLLAFARGGKYEVKPTDINTLIRNENRLFEKTRKDIDIVEILENGLNAVEIDRSQIRQALLNLYINASQAMPDGGTITVSTSQTVCDPLTARAFDVAAGEYIRIKVEDTGTGMDPETLSKVFEPFFSRSKHGSGTGLGLSSVYGIIRNHGGYVKIQSEVGKGTTVTINLPVSDLPVEDDATESKDLLPGTQTILLVDDEKMILDVGQKMLEKTGYTVYTAQNGKRAIEIMKDKGKLIDAAIVDMVMPCMNGSETAKGLRKIRPDIPILFSSGYSQETLVQDSIKSEDCAFIQKPYTLHDLTSRLKDILSGRKQK